VYACILSGVILRTIGQAYSSNNWIWIYLTWTLLAHIQLLIILPVRCLLESLGYVNGYAVYSGFLISKSPKPRAGVIIFYIFYWWIEHA
jgi:hypothetical protein